DVSAQLLRTGFRPENMRTLAVDAAPPVLETTPRNLAAGLVETSRRARDGCLLYLTSHGAPQGIVFGRSEQGRSNLPPDALARLLDRTCGRRPTVVMVSACFSGVYVPALSAPNRLILTAARPDRTSFGCGEDDVYPFFDACVLESWPGARDFLALGSAVRTCVARRETQLGLRPPSEPQMSVGSGIRPLLPLLTLPGAKTPARAG
ncbi:MAG: C13 family peptidase, partial [Pseudomonadota bacterium]|nr:C13 family peptidase [Pseudomonadota bacterium]